MRGSDFGGTPERDYRRYIASGILSLVILSMLSSASRAWETLAPASPDSMVVETNEPLFAGASLRDGKWSLEYLLSVRLPMGEPGWWKPFSPDQVYLLGLTLQGSQELGLPSSPVIGKRFHVQALPMIWDRGDWYFGLSPYGHESNGQSVESAAVFDALVAELDAAKNVSPSQAYDFARARLSRGWDLTEFSIGRRLDLEPLVFQLRLKASVPHDKGIFQEDSEETADFEDVEVDHRREVNGLQVSTAIKYTPSCCSDGLRLWLAYETGTHDPLQRHSINTTVGVPLCVVIVQFMFGHGYANDLAEFNRKTTDWALVFAWGGADRQTLR